MGSFGDRPWSWSEQQTFIRKLNKQLGSLRTATVVGGPGEEPDPPAIGFFDLYDVTPDSYESQAYKVVRVQSNEEALEFGVLTGTENQVYITPNASAHVFSLPQDIHYEATPLFHGLYLKGSDNDRSFLQFIVTGEPDEYIGIQPPEDILSSHTYTLPEDHGVPYEMLWSDANAILTWGWLQQNTYIGEGAGTISPTADAWDNVVIGYGAAPLIDDAYDNVIIGSEAGASLTDEFDSIYIGARVGALISGGSGNILIGTDLVPTATTANNNVIIGTSDTGYRLGTATRSLYIGHGAGWGMKDGTENVFLGVGAGCNAVYAGYNIAVGVDAGEDFRGGEDNIFIGSECGPTDYGVRFGYGNIWLGADIINQIQMGLDEVYWNLYLGGDLASGYYYYVFSYYLKDPSSTTGVGWEGTSNEFLEVDVTTPGYNTIKFLNIPTAFAGPLICTKRIIYRTAVRPTPVATTHELERWMFKKIGEIPGNVETTFIDSVGDEQRNGEMYGLLNTIAIGDSASICVGSSATIGRTLERVYWNTPFVPSGNPTSIAHHASSGWGTDKTGGDFHILSGRGTGSGVGGSIIFSTSYPEVSGSALQVHEEMGRFDPWGFSIPCVISNTEPAETRSGMLWVEVPDVSVWKYGVVGVYDVARVVTE